MFRVPLDDVDIRFDVADTRHRFNFLFLGRHRPDIADVLSNYLLARPTHEVSPSAVDWVLTKLWRDKS